MNPFRIDGKTGELVYDELESYKTEIAEIVEVMNDFSCDIPNINENTTFAEFTIGMDPQMEFFVLTLAASSLKIRTIDRSYKIVNIARQMNSQKY